jgi:uncharacterized protein YbaP (TraB family)
MSPKILLKFIFIYCFVTSSILYKSYSQDNTDYSLLWKIEGQNLKEPSYLFGTMHVEDKRAFNFSDQVLPAIEHSEKFALEIHPDSLMSFLKTMTNGKTPGYLKIKSVLKDKEYKKVAKRYFEVNKDSLENSNLTDVESLISSLLKEDKKEDDNQVFVDLHLLSQARTMSKTIVGLEDQNNYFSFDSLSVKKQRKYILDYLKYDSKTYNSYLEKLKKIYISGNLEAIDVYLKKNKGYDKELTRRNIEMANSIALILKNSTLFAAVGVAHLPGETGIIKLLLDMGFTVTKVDAEFTGVAKTYKVDKNLANWQSYKNDSLAYIIKVPGYIVPDSNNEDFSFNYGVNIASGHSYLFFALDNRENYSPGNDELLYKNYLNNFKSAYNVVHDTLVPFTYKNLEGYELRLKTLSEDSEINEYYKLRMLINNGLIYSYGAFGKEAMLTDANTETFFNSFNILKTFPLLERDDFNNWKKFSSKEGAFSINIPGDYTDFSRKADLNQDGEIVVYDLNLYYSSDKENNDNFLFRYNDLPLGYRLESLKTAFDEMETTLLQKASHLSTPKDVIINGMPGKEYELLIDEKYHTIVKVVFRGNRMYLLMHQKLDSNFKADSNHKFFNSFKFLPFEKEKTKKIKEDFFEYENFSKSKKEISETLLESYLESSSEIASLDTLTGNAYFLNYSKLKPFFKTDTLSVFYENTIKEYETYKEVITKKNHISFNGIDAIDFELTTTADSIVSKHRLWLDQGHYFLASAYPSKETLEFTNLNTFLNSYKPVKNLKHKSIYTLKANAIFKGLKKKDSITKYKALNAFDYYIFEQSEIHTLHKILKYNYKDSIFKNEVISKVNSEFSAVNNQETLTKLEHVYLEPFTSGMNKQDILYTIQNYKPANYLTTYNNLLFNHTPISEETYSYILLSPYRDSIALTISNYDKLLKLNDVDGYRASTIDLFTDVLNNDSINHEIIIKDYKKPLMHLNKDSSNYFEELGTEEYPDSENITAYLNYFKALPTLTNNFDEFEGFLDQILNSKAYSWLKSTALQVKINQNLEVSETIKKNVLDSLENPLSIIKLYETRNEINEIPKAYLTTEFAKLSVKQYLYDNDEYTDDYIFETPFNYENKTYQPVILTYPDYDEKYILVVQLKDSIYNSNGKIEAFPCETLWDTFDENYKEKSLNLVKNSEYFE